MTRTLIALSLAAFAAPALAAPPDDALPLSQILAQIEAEPDFGYFDEIDWDDDGHWEIEYHRADDTEVNIEIDAVSGQRRDG